MDETQVVPDSRVEVGGRWARSGAAVLGNVETLDTLGIPALTGNIAVVRLESSLVVVNGFTKLAKFLQDASYVVARDADGDVKHAFGQHFFEM